MFSTLRVWLPSASITGRLQRGVGLWAALALLFSLLAVIQTWPLVLHATDSVMDVPIAPGDTWVFLWDLW